MSGTRHHRSRLPSWGPSTAVAAALAAVYLGVVIAGGYADRVDETMLSLADARQYRAVADWLVHGEPTRATLIRPLLYPLLLGATSLVADPWGTWAFQAALWLAAGVLLFAALRALTGSLAAAVAGAAVYGSNLTLVLLTLHAMPEVLAVFLLCGQVAVVAGARRLGADRALLLLLALAALLTATKPVFVGLFLPLLLLAVARAAVRPAPPFARAGWLALACVPVLLQLGTMTARHGVLELSAIDQAVVRRYAAPRLEQALRGGSLEEARARVEAMSGRELAATVIGSPVTAARVWLGLVWQNLRAGSAVTDIPEPHPRLSGFMRRLNAAAAALHLVMIVPTLLLVVVFARGRDGWRLAELAALALPFLWLLATSGLTFWQGDRIVLPALPLWIALYGLVTVSWTDVVRQGARAARTSAPTGASASSARWRSGSP